jgi:hypothetical protein
MSSRKAAEAGFFLTPPFSFLAVNNTTTASGTFSRKVASASLSQTEA